MSLTKTEFGSAFQAGFGQTVRFLASRGVPVEDAQDVAQGAWAKGWEKRHHLRNPASVGSWINSIALNLFRKRCREEKRYEGLPETELPATSGGIHAGIEVKTRLRTCSKSERRMIGDYLAGYTSKEIGRRWNLKATAVRVRLHRAKQKLRDYGQCAVPRPA